MVSSRLFFFFSRRSACLPPAISSLIGRQAGVSLSSPSKFVCPSPFSIFCPQCLLLKKPLVFFQPPRLIQLFSKQKSRLLTGEWSISSEFGRADGCRLGTVGGHWLDLPEEAVGHGRLGLDAVGHVGHRRRGDRIVERHLRKCLKISLYLIKMGRGGGDYFYSFSYKRRGRPSTEW